MIDRWWWMITKKSNICNATQSTIITSLKSGPWFLAIRPSSLFLSPSISSRGHFVQLYNCGMPCHGLDKWESTRRPRGGEYRKPREPAPGHQREGSSMPENKGCVLKEPRLFYHPHIDDLHSETKMIGGHWIADLPIFRRKNYAFTVLEVWRQFIFRISRWV